MSPGYKGDAWVTEQVEKKKKALDKLGNPSFGFSSKNATRTGAAATAAATQGTDGVTAEEMAGLFDLYMERRRMGFAARRISAPAVSTSDSEQDSGPALGFRM